MKKLLILLRGLPGSGKSTLAQELAGRLGGEVFSADELLMSDSGYGWSPSLAVSAHEVCEKLVHGAILRGRTPLIVDNMNLRASRARPYVNIARQFGYEIEVREPSTPWKNDLEGLLKNGTHNVPRDQMEDMIATFGRIPMSDFKKALEID